MLPLPLNTGLHQPETRDFTPHQQKQLWVPRHISATQQARSCSAKDTTEAGTPLRHSPVECNALVLWWLRGTGWCKYLGWTLLTLPACGAAKGQLCHHQAPIFGQKAVAAPSDAKASVIQTGSQRAANRIKF